MILLLLSACASIPISPSGYPLDPATLCHTPPGFWSGLWHGLISPFSFTASLFVDNTLVYAICNSGGWYDLGFMIGLAAALGSSGGAGATAAHVRR